MCKKAGFTVHVAIRRNNFPPVWSEGGPDFTSRRRIIDISQLLKGQSENFEKVVV
jgi:hypothetical protein